MRIPVFLNLGTAQTQQWSVIILQTCDLYKQHCDSNIQDFDAYYTGLIIAAHTASKVFIHITRAGCNFTLISYIHNFANDHHPLLCSRARMSFLGKIFGGKGGQDKPVTTGEAIQKLRETEDMLMKKQVFLKSVLTKIHRWSAKQISEGIPWEENRIRGSNCAEKCEDKQACGFAGIEEEEEVRIYYEEIVWGILWEILWGISWEILRKDVRKYFKEYRKDVLVNWSLPWVPCGSLQSSISKPVLVSLLVTLRLYIKTFSFRYDSQLQQIDGTLSTIEMQREALEGANTNTAVLTTMNDAAKALKKANNELDVDKVAGVDSIGMMAFNWIF